MTTLNELFIAEATEYEFKSGLDLKKPKSWLKTVSAFTNGLGGSIYFGVANSGGVHQINFLRNAEKICGEIIDENNRN